MVHVATSSRIATVTTNAMATVANDLEAQLGDGAFATGNEADRSGAPRSVWTKAWSCLEARWEPADPPSPAPERAVTSDWDTCSSRECGSLQHHRRAVKAKSERRPASSVEDNEALEVLRRVQHLSKLLPPPIDWICKDLPKMGKIVGGATLPRDAGPEDLAVVLETRRSCEEDVLAPMEEAAAILDARRDLLREMHDRQRSELARLTGLLDEVRKRRDASARRAAELEAGASALASRSAAVLAAVRELRPRITDAEAAYFKDLRGYEASVSKWEGAARRAGEDATAFREAVEAAAGVEGGGGDARCLVDLPPEKEKVVRNLLRGEGQILKNLDRKVAECEKVVERLSKVVAGVESEEAARLRLVGGDKENQRM
ncbi:hypothetical protein ACHAWF_015352 [Thalassiosira exigua]